MSLYESDGTQWVKVGGGSGGGISVTDGVTTVSPATEIDFTSGATVTDGGGGVAQVAIGGGSGIEFGISNTGSYLDITVGSDDGTQSILLHDTTAGGSNGDINIISDNRNITLTTTLNSIYFNAGNFLAIDANGTFLDIQSTGAQFYLASGANFTVYDFSSQPLITAQDGQVLAFYAGTTPVTQPAAIPAPTGGLVVDTEARAAIASILNALGAAAGGVGITA